MHRHLIALLLTVPLAATSAEPLHGGPVIDMHVHAYAMEDLPPGIPACPGDQRVVVPTIDPGAALDFSGPPPCEKPIFGAMDAADHRDRTLAELRRHNVRRAMTDGPVALVADWRKVAGDDTIIIPGVGFGTRKSNSTDELRRLHRTGQLAVLG